MIRKILFAGLASVGLMTTAAYATETIVWWDFLSGGDGVRMKSMLDQFNKEHEGKVQIDATTLEWGVPSTPRCKRPPPSDRARTS